MRRGVLISVPLVLGLALPANAQEAPPPIDVPTAPVPQGPVPQGPTPPPPPAAKPKPAPAPPSAPASGDKKPAEAPTPETPKEPAKYNNEGVFKVSGSKGSGVVGGQKQKGEKPAPTTHKGGAKKAASNATVAQWPGFRMLDDGSSEVLVDFSRDPVTPTEHKAAGSITYSFKGVHVAKSNNKNPLITVHFNTPVTSVRLVPTKGALDLVIDTRADVTPTTSVRAGEGGEGKIFAVRFPAGTFLPAGAEDTEAPAPTQKLKIKGGKSDKGSTTPPPSGGATKPGPSE